MPLLQYRNRKCEKFFSISFVWSTDFEYRLLGMLVSYFYICHSSSLHNPGHELKNESCMVISNLLSYLGFCHFPPHLSKTSDYWIFFNFIFNFKILSLLLKDLINPFLSKLHWQISSTLFCFFFVFLLPYPFFLLFVWFSLILCFQPFDFLLFFEQFFIMWKWETFFIM